MILEILRCQILKDIKTFLEHIKVYPVSLQRRIYEPIPCETAKINELAPKYKKKKKNHLTTTWISLVENFYPSSCKETRVLEGTIIPITRFVRSNTR